MGVHVQTRSGGGGCGMTGLGRLCSCDWEDISDCPVSDWKVFGKGVCKDMGVEIPLVPGLRDCNFSTIVYNP